VASSQQVLAGVAAGAAALLIVTAGYFASQRDREDTVVAVGEPQVSSAPLSGPTATPQVTKTPTTVTPKNPGNGGIVGNGVSTVNQNADQGKNSGGNVPQRPGGDVGGDTGKGDTGGGARPATAIVPSVVNLHLGQAQSTLNGAGLKVSVSYRAVTDRAQDDVVLGQDPGERTTVYAGSTVRITVGQLGTVAVPSVVDQSRDSAERQVNDAGLKSSVSYQKVDDPAKDDVVLSQSPNGGSQAKAGDTVGLVVGQINTVQVPSVVRLPLADAQRRLNDAKLRSSVTDQTVQDKTQDGIVQAQDRPAGSTVNVGTDVTLTVGRYVAPITQVQVPPVVGLMLADAQKRVEGARLKWSVSYYDPGDASGQDGAVRAQTPSGGTMADVGSTVVLTVNKRAIKDCSPASVGKQSLAQARSTLETAGFKVSVTNQAVTDPALKDVVLAQTPAAGTLVACGSTVTLTVGQLQQVVKVPVPNVVHLAQSAAVGQINGANLKASVTTQTVTDKALDGVVISQNPGGGTQVDPGSTVTLTVGTYATPKVPVPNVVNQAQSAAVGQVNGANLKSSVTTQTVTDQAKDGVVLSQSPSGGSQVDAGSTVTLTVGKYAAPKVAVPNVVDQSQAAAQSQLSGAGLTMSATSADVTDQTKNGVVISQSPASGTKVDPGTTVSVTLGHYVSPLG
jgi:beta-lactam-binding protein with PASTA domain